MIEDIDKMNSPLLDQSALPQVKSLIEQVRASHKCRSDKAAAVP